ncbi:MAG: hemerythrin domain-containing protein [Dokdonella sp.]
MPDSKSKRGARDRARVAADETYEVDYFAERHGISRQEAQALIERVGNDRAKLDAAIAEKAKGSAPKPRRRTAAGKAGAASAPAAAPKRASVSRSSAARKVAETAAPVTAAVESAAATVIEPVAKAAAPATRRAAGLRRRVASAVRTGATSTRDIAASAPKTARKRAGAALDTARSTVTGRAASLVGAAAAGLVTGLAVNFGRKMVVQAPTALAGDWLEGLKVEHKLALALFDQIQATDNSETAQRSALLTQLKHALGKHAFTEENVIYPALRAWGDKADADKLNHDHGYVKQYLYDLEEADNGTPAFLEKVAEFRAQIEAHIREEEDAIFPPLHAALGEVGNAKVTAQANKEGFKLA